MLGPADDDHQLSVCQVTQRGEGLDVALGHGGVGHGVDLLWLGHQQVGHDFGDWGGRGHGKGQRSLPVYTQTVVLMHSKHRSLPHILHVHFLSLSLSNIKFNK